MGSIQKFELSICSLFCSKIKFYHPLSYDKGIKHAFQGKIFRLQYETKWF